MDRIFEAIETWMRDLLTGMVSSNLTTMYTDVNEKTGEIAAQVGQTPQGWNGNIFSMIQNLSDSVIVPIAGMIITFVLCYELISMLTEKNNMHDLDTWMFFKYFFKMWVAVWIVSHTFTITMAVFDVGQTVVSRAAGVISCSGSKGKRNHFIRQRYCAGSWIATSRLWTAGSGIQKILYGTFKTWNFFPIQWKAGKLLPERCFGKSAEFCGSYVL